VVLSHLRPMHYGVCRIKASCPSGGGASRLRLQARHPAMTTTVQWIWTAIYIYVSYSAVFPQWEGLSFRLVTVLISRSQWPRGLRDGPSSLSRNTGIVGSNPNQGMDVCVRLFCVFVLFCVYVATLRRADPPSKESYWLCIGIRNWKSCSTKGL
jgi:hypothetical protein